MKELFGIDNSKVKFAKTERVDKQYYIDFKITNADVINIIRIAEEFNPSIYDFIDKLTSEQIKKYREEFAKSLNETTDAP